MQKCATVWSVDAPFDSHEAAAQLEKAWYPSPGPSDYARIVGLVSSLQGVRERADQIAMLSLAGSHGYGLAHPKSDLDLRGFFIMPSREYLAAKSNPEVEPRPAQLKSSAADLVLDEVGRFVRECMRVSPNIFEILWAPVILDSDAAHMLRENRHLFVSSIVRDSYGGFAGGQKREALKIGDQADEERMVRRSKYIRHMLRVLHQGSQLLSSGEMDYRLDDAVIARMRSLEFISDAELEELFLGLDADFKALASDLPPKPDANAISEILVQIRLDDLRRREPALLKP